jgi:hypothetical protein
MSETATNKASEIERLGNLLRQGLLSEDEFQAAKRQVLQQSIVLPADTNTDIPASTIVAVPKSNANAVTYPGFDSKYGVAKGLSSFLSFIGWACFLLGVIAFLSGLTKSGIDSIAPLALGLIGVVGGLLQVAAAQIMLTMIDTADHARGIFMLLNKNCSATE